MKLGPLRGTCESPVPDMVTWYVAFDVLVGTYCTLIEQVKPGLTTAPFMQVPPVIEKFPVPVPLTFANVGAAVSVSGAVAVASLLTVMVAIFVLEPPPFINGAGAEIETTAPNTVNVLGLLVPPAVETVTLWFPSVAPGAITNVAVICVPALFTTTLLTVIPVPAFTVARSPPKLVPIRVTATLVPRTPEAGLTVLNVGVA